MEDLSRWQCVEWGGEAEKEEKPGRAKSLS